MSGTLTDGIEHQTEHVGRIFIKPCDKEQIVSENRHEVLLKKKN
jgi:hypothetical protein